MNKVFKAAASLIGNSAELKAKHYLLKHELDFIENNFRTKRGEIDLIMKDMDTIVFVEVRYRSNTQYGCAAETVTQAKQNKIIMAAQEYMLNKNWTNQMAMRFDVVAISQSEINWIKSAF